MTTKTKTNNKLPKADLPVIEMTENEFHEAVERAGPPMVTGQLTQEQHVIVKQALEQLRPQGRNQLIALLSTMTAVDDFKIS